MNHRPQSTFGFAMNLLRTVLLFLIAGVLAPALLRVASAQNTNFFELRDGDRVVMVGDTFIEREREYGILESLATTQFPDRHVTFRNLGWSADSPQGQSRVGFDHSKPSSEWFKQLTNSIAQLKPTVIFLGYGMANSFAGEAGLPAFIADLTKLMDSIQQNAGTTPLRWVIFSPVPHETLAAPLPDPTKHNAQLAAYTKALKDLAAQRGTHFVNLFDGITASVKQAANVKQTPLSVTDNGIPLNGYGYRVAANVMAAELGWKRRM